MYNTYLLLNVEQIILKFISCSLRAIEL
jgi:hypothetical protein